ncbi:MAG: hypothetical protein RL701_2540, partial [Pseudomonadota bacterium]
MNTRFFFAGIGLLCTSAVSGCNLGADLPALPFQTPDAGAKEQDPATAKPGAAGSGAGTVKPNPAPDVMQPGTADPSKNPEPERVTEPMTEPEPSAENPVAGPLAADHGSAVAFTPDDNYALVVNRDVGSVSVLALTYDKAAVKTVQLVKEVLLGEGSEPYQVVISPDGLYAYVVLRRDQALVKIDSLATAPNIAGKVAVGSEPTGVALSSDGRYAYVANSNDGTVTQVDTTSLSVTRTIDLNAALVQTGYLGTLQPRAALAHPRSIAVHATDHGDELFVTEFFGQQIEAELADGSNSDTRKVGVVYKVNPAEYSVKTIRLGALNNLGFLDERGEVTGCYPNQLQAISLNGDYAYVVSVCASPKGPLGVKVTTTACTAVEECQVADLKLQEPACITPFAGAPNNVCVDVASAKTTTAPVLSVIDTRTDREVGSSGVSLNARFDALYREKKTELGKQRFPLFASDIAFVPGTTVGYVSANGADGVFRFTVNAKTGEIDTVGGSTNLFIDLSPAGIAANKAGRNPVGVAIAHTHKKVALTANDVTRNASVLDFDSQGVAGGSAQPQVA